MKPGRVEHGLAGLLGVRHGVEAHQDVRQAGGAEHEREAQREGVERIVTRARPARGSLLAVHGLRPGRRACRS